MILQNLWEILTEILQWKKLTFSSFKVWKSKDKNEFMNSTIKGVLS